MKRSVFLGALLPVIVCSVMPQAIAERSHPEKALIQSASSSASAVAPSIGQIRTVSTEHRTAPGGANEVRGTKGKVGDWFFNGLWRFRVNAVSHPDVYHYKYSPQAVSDKPSGPNDELVVFDCTIKNGQHSADQPILSGAGLASQATALTDDQDNSYPPIDFDARNGDVNPGAGKSFAVIFSVPKGTNLSTLIFTIYSYGNPTKLTNVRVSVAGL